MVYEQREGEEVRNMRKGKNKCDKDVKDKCTETEKQVVAVENSKTNISHSHPFIPSTISKYIFVGRQQLDRYTDRL